MQLVTPFSPPRGCVFRWSRIVGGFGRIERGFEIQKMGKSNQRRRKRDTCMCVCIVFRKTTSPARCVRLGICHFFSKINKK